MMRQARLIPCASDHIEHAPGRGERAICVGKFDGLHRGHRALYARAQSCGFPTILHMTGMAAALGWEPREPLLSAVHRCQVLESWAQEDASAIILLSWPFEQLQRCSVRDFCRILVEEMGACSLVVGRDFRCAHGRSAGVEEVAVEAAAHGLSLEIVDAVCSPHDHQLISSTRIRKALSCGAVAEATDCYGRPHRLYGRVDHGDGRGRKLGFPTANLCDTSNLIPAEGVYAGYAHCPDGSIRKAAINIGRAPSIGLGRPRSVEAHLLDWQGDLYGSSLSLDLIARLREERVFSDLADLITQVKEDCAQVRQLL